MHFPDRTKLLEYHRRMVAALRAVDRQFVDVISRPDSGFSRMTRDEFDEAVRLLREELDAQVTMMVIASCEATLKRDFRHRLERKARRDPLWARVFALNESEKLAGQKHGPRITPLLKMWRDFTGRPLADAFKLVKLRNWLAHGRCYSHGSGVGLDPRQAALLIENFFRALKSAQSDFPLS